MILLIIAALLAAAVVLCGYTTVRLPVRRGEGKRHIACAGDSVTYGCTLPMFFLYRYPAVLQRMIGSDAQVAAFAVNDRTLQNTGNKPFRKERAFRQSMEFRPDTVVILLGTNDSKDNNWISPAAFRQQYTELINAYRALPAAPRIVICTPPCAFKPINRFFYITNDAKLDRIPEIAEEIKRIAAENGTELVDLYALTQGKRELFGPDGLHPNAAGAKRIAEAVFRKLCLDLPVWGDRNGQRPPGLDEEQVSQMLRLHQSLPGLGDPVREKDSLPRPVRQSGFEVKPGNTYPEEA